MVAVEVAAAKAAVEVVAEEGVARPGEVVTEEGEVVAARVAVSPTRRARQATPPVGVVGTPRPRSRT